MTSAEYLERYHKALQDVVDRELPAVEWQERRKWAAEFREAYLLMREVEEREQGEAMTDSFLQHHGGMCIEPAVTKPTGSYLELKPRDPVRTQAAAMNPGDVYEDANGDICIWAPDSDERHRGYTGCCWFDPVGDGATSTSQYHEEITVIGRLTAVYPDKES